MLSDLLKNFIFYDNHLLKKFHLLNGILLFCLLTLHIESIFHNHRIHDTIFNELLDSVDHMHKNSFEYSSSRNYSPFAYNLTRTRRESINATKEFFRFIITQDSEDNKLVYELCKICNNDALKSISTFNVFGIMLAGFLAYLCFLSANKSRFLIKNLNVSIILFFLSIFINILHFIMTAAKKLPPSCTEIPKPCSSDYDYHFHSKLTLINGLMLLTIPLSIFQLISLLNGKMVKSKSKKLKSDESYGDDQWNNMVDFSNHKLIDQNKRVKQSNHANLTSNTSTFEEFREVPIDCCPFVNNSSNTILNRSKSLNDLQENLNNVSTTAVDNQNFYFVYDSDLSKTQVATALGQSSRAYNSTNKLLSTYRNTSLSTILEESSLSLTKLSAHTEKYRNSEGVKRIQEMLEDFQIKIQAMNEILRVFEPSSEHGLFKRNVPVRLTSQAKSPNNSLVPSSSPNTSSSSKKASSGESDYSKYSPISYKKAIAEQPSIENVIFLNINQMHTHLSSEMHHKTRNARLIDRLKNRIENIKGMPITKIQLNSQIKAKSIQSITQHIEDDMNNFKRINGELTIRRSSSQIIAKSDIQPVYF